MSPLEAEIIAGFSPGQMMGRIKRWETVELTVPPNQPQGRVSFDDQPQLRNQANQIIIITDVEVFLDTVVANSQETPTIPGMAAVDLPLAVLTLNVGNEETIFQIPLGRINKMNDFINPFIWKPEGFLYLVDVNWDKCYVQFSAAPTATTFIIPFGVSYFRFKKDPNSKTEKWVER